MSGAFHATASPRIGAAPLGVVRGATAYHVEDERPLLVWEDFTECGIAQLEWSPTRPGLFWARDDEGAMHVFDVAEPSGAPLQSTPVPRLAGAGAATQGAAAPRKPRFALSGGGAGRGAAPREGEAPRQRMAGPSMLGEDGSPCAVELHLLVDRLAQPGEAAAAQLAEALRRL